MRIGLVGAAGEGEENALQEAMAFLLQEADVEETIYLGADSMLDRMLKQWLESLWGTTNAKEAFIQRAAALADSGTPEEIDALLQADSLTRRLSSLRKLPPSPTRAVEIIGDRILLAVHDKAILTEEDIANAHLVVYGRSKEACIRQFGHRYFITPGPVNQGEVLVLESNAQFEVSIALYETNGTLLQVESLVRPGAQMDVKA